MIYGGGRAIIYIHKRHPLASWTYEAHRDYCKITLNGIDFYSIYSPIPPPIRRARLVTLWLSPIHLLAELERPNKAILMGDFNLHHPLWDLFDRETYGAEDWGLQLITPYGTPTRRFQGQRNSTLDHAWVSAPNGAFIAIYEGEGDYKGSNHRPQIITLNDDYISP